MKDPGHSAKSASGRLQLNSHTPLTQRSQSGLTIPLCRHSVGTYPETRAHETCQGTFGHSRLSWLSHCGPILVERVNLMRASYLHLKKAQAGNEWLSILQKNPRKRGKSHHHHHHHHHTSKVLPMPLSAEVASLLCQSALQGLCLERLQRLLPSLLSQPARQLLRVFCSVSALLLEVASLTRASSAFCLRCALSARPLSSIFFFKPFTTAVFSDFDPLHHE